MLDKLNEQQRRAILHKSGPLLIVAGAGSGKTLVLTMRIANLIKNGILPQNILAITFTNKAADEMRSRLIEIIGKNNMAPMFIGTFHSLGSHILRQDISCLGFNQNFTILDEEDSLNLIRGLIKNSREFERLNPKLIQESISRLKSELISPQNAYSQAQESFEKTVAKFYQKYNDELKKNNLLDFDDLLFKTILLFKKYPGALEKYQNKFQYISIDEYQDTNQAQYQFVKLLAKKNRNLCVVGDEDQSIYTWRGADFRNILNFEKDWPGAKIIFLEENYRSTKNILTSANEIIAKNKQRKPKVLYTKNQIGEKVYIVGLNNEKEEAEFVIDKIKSGLKNGKRLKDFAILFRIGAQSRIFEEMFIRNQMPYRLVGGFRFYERKEVKDIIAYLKIILNPKDRISLNRIINVPSRGLGKTTQEKIFSKHPLFRPASQDYRGQAHPQQKYEKQTLHPSLIRSIKDKKVQTSLLNFFNLIEELRKKSLELKTSELIKFLINKINYKDYLKSPAKKQDEVAEERWANVLELIGASKFYDKFSPAEGLKKFLESVSLFEHTDTIKNKENRAFLMTIHSAKGLEFDTIFVVGAEDGLIPHHLRLSLPDEIEEERRLMYVALTRAKSRAFITFAKQRKIWGRDIFNPVSRFVLDLPEENIDIQILFENDNNESIGKDDGIEYLDI